MDHLFFAIIAIFLSERVSLTQSTDLCDYLPLLVHIIQVLGARLLKCHFWRVHDRLIARNQGLTERSPKGRDTLAARQ